MSLARSRPGWGGRFLAVAIFAMTASGAPAQGDDLLAQARAAEARLDFRTAYSLFETAMSAAPEAAAPYLARALLHRTLARPALALADLERAQALAQDDPEPLVAAGDIWLENNAPRTAIRAYNAALDRTPAHLGALAGRASAHAKAGLLGNALADYDRALSLAPGDTALTAARGTLIEARAAQRVGAISYDPAALMTPEFRIAEGPPDADDRLVIVEAGNELVAAEAGLDPAALAGAIENGRLQLTRIFTYTGQDSAIWANLALICGGREAHAALRAALTAEDGRAALATVDGTGDLAPLKTLVGEAYAQSGLGDTALDDCAFNRGRALRYLAEWTDKHESLAWKGVNFYDFWPVYIWNDTPVTLNEARGLVAQKLPADPETGALKEPQHVGENEAVTPPEDQDGRRDGEAEQAAGVATPPEVEPPLVAVAESEAGDPQPAEAPDRAEPARDDSPPEAREPDPAPDQSETTLPPEPMQATTTRAHAPVIAEGRVPVELRGIYAPDLVSCIAYDDRLEATEALDEILPALNALDGTPIGTVLLASQRFHLFNATSTECGLAALPDIEPGAPWRGEFSCANALAPNVITPLELVRIESEGPAPQLEARLGSADPVALIQCRPFGLLGRDAAPLWNFVEAECRLRAPVNDTALDFRADAEGRLVLHISPDGALAGATAPRLGLDGVEWETDAPTLEGTAWRFDLGAFRAASERLGLGLFFDVTGADGGVALRLPLLGSAAAMARLATCAPASQQGDDG